MCERDHQNFRVALKDNDRVRKASEDQSFDSALSGYAGHGYQRDDIFFKQIERCVDRALEFCAESRTFFFVPCGGFGSLVRRRFMDTQRAH